MVDLSHAEIHPAFRGFGYINFQITLRVVSSTSAASGTVSVPLDRSHRFTPHCASVSLNAGGPDAPVDARFSASHHEEGIV
jgi:hypothetical protein